MTNSPQNKLAKSSVSIEVFCLKLQCFFQSAQVRFCVEFSFFAFLHFFCILNHLKSFFAFFAFFTFLHLKQIFDDFEFFHFWWNRSNPLLIYGAEIFWWQSVSEIRTTSDLQTGIRRLHVAPGLIATENAQTHENLVIFLKNLRTQHSASKESKARQQNASQAGFTWTQ